jgi:chromosome segregation ATPase
MSELQKKVEAAFKDSSSKLAKLNKELDKIADLEQEMSSISSNIQLSSNGLRKLTKDHASYLQKADELNTTLAKIAETLAELNPKELDARLKSIEKEYSELRDRIRSSEVVITKAVNTVFYTLIIGLLCLGSLVVALLGM